MILNPSITFAMLKLDAKKAMNCISVEHLEKVDSLDLLSYVPSIVYSLVPGNRFTEFYRIEFATDAIRWLTIACLTQSKRNDLVMFLKECDKFNVASSLLGSVFEGLMHVALANGGVFKVKRLNGPLEATKDTEAGAKEAKCRGAGGAPIANRNGISMAFEEDACVKAVDMGKYLDGTGRKKRVITPKEIEDLGGVSMVYLSLNRRPRLMRLEWTKNLNCRFRRLVHQVNWINLPQCSETRIAVRYSVPVHD